MERKEMPDEATQELIDAVFNLKIETHHRLTDLANAVQRLSVDYSHDVGSALAIGDQIRTIYDDADEALLALRAIVEVEVIDKVRTLLDADESTP